MAHDKDDRKRSHLRLVVDNAAQRSTRPVGDELESIPLEELIARRDDFRPLFYRGMERWQA